MECLDVTFPGLRSNKVAMKDTVKMKKRIYGKHRQRLDSRQRYRKD
jgi:hypothetical protein